MTRRNWKRVRPNSFLEALRLCKEHAQERLNLSVERIADVMGVTHDSLYKWLGTGRMPGILIPAYENACGISLVSEWLSAARGRLVIDMPAGRKVEQTDLLALNSGFAAALQVLTEFYAKQADPKDTLAALANHLQQVAWHHANVERSAEPQLDFSTDRN